MTAPSDGVPDTPTALQVATKALHDNVCSLRPHSMMGPSETPPCAIGAEAVLAALLSSPLAETQWGVRYDGGKGEFSTFDIADQARRSAKRWNGLLLRRQRLVLETEWKDEKP